MGHSNESMRRKDNCVSCNNYKPIKAKNMCQNCWHKYKSINDFNFFIRQKYSQIKQRCTNIKRLDYLRYFGKLKMTLTEFYNFSMNNPIAKELWEKSRNREYKNKASVDRIDATGNYEIGNIQWMEHGANSLKDQDFTPVDVYDKSGNLIGSYVSLTEGAKVLGVHQANAWKVYHGLRKSTGGYVFKPKKESYV